MSVTRTGVNVFFCLLLLAGCTADPCEHARSEVAGRGGAASLDIPVIGQRYSPGRSTFEVDCVNVLIVRHDAYRDTLAAGLGLLAMERVRVTGLPVDRADVIVGGGRYFPVKIIAVGLSSGRNQLEDRLFMYRWRNEFHVPGEIEMELAGGSTIEDVRPLFGTFDGAEAEGSGSTYRVRIASESSLEADVRLLQLCRKLTASEHVISARPLVDFNLIYPAAGG